MNIIQIKRVIMKELINERLSELTKKYVMEAIDLADKGPHFSANLLLTLASVNSALLTIVASNSMLIKDPNKTIREKFVLMGNKAVLDGYKITDKRGLFDELEHIEKQP